MPSCESFEGEFDGRVQECILRYALSKRGSRDLHSKRKVGWCINMLPYQEGGGAGCSGDPAELCTSDA